MATGPNSGVTFTDDATVGTVVWTGPGNAAASDNVYATAALVVTDTISHYLKATNFGFTLPTGNVIDGILVEVEVKRAGDTAVRDYSVKIVKGGTIGGTEKANGTNWSTVDAYISYGGSTDLWGLSWTATDINGTTFGVAIAAQDAAYTIDSTAYIDHIRITVYHHATQTLSATSTGAASFARQVGKVMSVTASSTRTLVRAIARTMSLTAVGSASMVKSYTRIQVLAASASSSSALSWALIWIKTVAVTATSAASFVRRVNKTIAATATGNLTLVRDITKIISAGATGTASLVAAGLTRVFAAARRVASLSLSARRVTRVFAAARRVATISLTGKRPK